MNVPTLHPFFREYDKPFTMPEIIHTIELMAKHGVLYHFDDEATDCLRNSMTRPEAEMIQLLVDHMMFICSAKGIDIFEIALDTLHKYVELKPARMVTT